MMPFSLFLALKYLKPRRSFVSVVTIISIIGVLLGVAILIIVLSVMTGFDDMWRDKILSFNAHLTVIKPGDIIQNDEETAAEIRKIPGVTCAEPHVQTIVLLQHGQKIAAPFLVGMAPDSTSIINQLPRHMTSGSFDISEGNIILGVDLAAQLDLRPGDKVLVYSPRCVMAKDEIQLPDELTVSGIFELGMWEFDSNFVLVSIGSARAFYGIDGGAVAIRVMTADPFAAPKLAGAIEAKLGPEYQAMTWMDMNRTLFDALRVEKSMMFMLLVFITIVAMFSVTNTLIVIGVQKTDEIGLLKAIGFSPSQIMGVFVWHGWIQCVVGTAGGIGSGLLMLHYRNEVVRWLSERLGVDLFPKAIYLLSEIPSRTSALDVAMISLAVFVFCTIASIIPAARAAALNPVDALRHE